MELILFTGSFYGLDAWRHIFVCTDFYKIIILNLPFLECTQCIHGHAKIRITIVLIKAYFVFFDIFWQLYMIEYFLRIWEICTSSIFLIVWYSNFFYLLLLLNIAMHCGIIIVRGGLMFVDFVGYPYHQCLTK